MRAGPLPSPAPWSLAAGLLVLTAIAVMSAPLPGHQTGRIQRLEPVTNYLVTHSEMHLARSVHSARKLNGVPQPLPETIRLEFSAFGQDHSYEMTLSTDFVTTDSKVVFVGADNVETHRQAELISYHHYFDDGSGWVVATMLKDGTFMGTVNKGGSVLQIDPVFVHERDMTTQGFHALQAAASHGMVAFRDVDVLDSESGGGGAKSFCGVAEQGPAGSAPKTVHLEDASPRSPASRRLLDYHVWDNCHQYSLTGVRLSFSIFADYSFFKSCGSDAERALTRATFFVAAANVIYRTQINLLLNPQEITIMTTNDQSVYSFNYEWIDVGQTVGGTCRPTINEALGVVRDAILVNGVNTYPKRGLYAQLTDCYSHGSGTLGLAYIAVTCSSYGISVNSNDRGAPWQVFAHEVGHNLGANHQVGLMNPTACPSCTVIDGVTQFNDLNKDEVCRHLTTSISGNSNDEKCWKQMIPTCGNGLVDVGEQCDDKGASGCCNMATCQFFANATCVSNGDCCANCRFRPASVTCGDGLGYCHHGFCHTSNVCFVQAKSHCGMDPVTKCKPMCSDGSSCVVQNGGLDVPDAVCDLAPYSTCVGTVCTPVPNTYTWDLTPWTPCSCIPAGGFTGTQQRTQICRDQTGLPADPSNCNATVWSTSQSCDCADYRKPTYSKCDNTCEGGTQWVNNSIACIFKGEVVSNATCSAFFRVKPAVKRSCNQQNCPHFWFSGGWSTQCATSCSGTRTRTVQCRRMWNGIQQYYGYDSPCLGDVPGPKPAESEACNCRWTAGTWSACSFSCGGGVQTNSSTCFSVTQNAAFANNLCEAANLGGPARSRACNTQACPLRWRVGNWSACSGGGCGTQTRDVRCVQKKDFMLASCGGGTRIRTLTCVSNTQATVANSNCAAQAPLTSEACSTAACPVYWHSGDWSSCSKTCGSGTWTRAVECRIVSTDAAVDPSQCTASKPASSATCNAFACPHYEGGAWSTCSATCGDGVQSRTVSCVDYQGQHVSLSACTSTNAVAIATEQVCNLQPCPSWVTGDWNDCSKPCGSGSQTRSVTCRMPAEAPWFSAESNGCTATKPATTQSCNTDECPSFYWSTGTWGACSAQCTPPGGSSGTQTATVSCINSITNQAVDESNCFLGTKPASSRNCNTQTCSDFRWFVATEFAACSCSPASHLRSVVCRDYAPQTLTVVADSKCAAAGTKPTTTQDCPDGATLCNQQGSCAEGDSAVCVCRNGYTGDSCAVAPTIAEVTSNADIYSEGVPLGESLEVSWAASSGLETVSVALYHPSWPYPIYMVQNAPNTGYVQAPLPANVQAGEGYTIRVWFSSGVYADSAPFAVGQPCEYVNCGLHGQCEDGVCHCHHGWSGAGCTVTYCVNCDAAHSTCDSTAHHAECACAEGWVGETCHTPAACANNCKHGSVRSGSSDACGTCQCENQWAGETCDTCPLQCSNGGAPFADCAGCACKTGFFGVTCDCRYSALSVEVANEGDFLWLKDASQVARFRATFASDIAAAVGYDLENVVVLNLTAMASAKKLGVMFRLQEDCPATSSGPINTAEAAAALVTQFADASSLVRRGLVTSQAYADSIQIVLPEEPESSSTGVAGPPQAAASKFKPWHGILIAVGVLAIALVAWFVYSHHYHCHCGHTRKVKGKGQAGGDKTAPSNSSMMQTRRLQDIHVAHDHSTGGGFAPHGAAAAAAPASAPAPGFAPLPAAAQAVGAPQVELVSSRGVTSHEEVSIQMTPVSVGGGAGGPGSGAPGHTSPKAWGTPAGNSRRVASPIRNVR